VTDPAAAQRYAEAFVNLLEKQGRLAEGLQGLGRVADVAAASADLRRFLGSPRIPGDRKLALLKKVFAASISPEIEGLLDLLIRWGRIDQLEEVARQAVEIAEAHRGVTRGTVTTAHPISSRETEAVAQAVGRRLGRQVVLERAVDPALLGGVQVAVGTVLFDGSLRRRLEDVSKELKQAKVS